MPSKSENLLHPVDLPGLRFPNNIWLAPMAGYTFKALRLFCANFGAGATYTEMVSIEGVVRRDRHTMEFLDIADEPRSVLQLFGGPEPEKFARAAKIVMERTGTKILDINFGCPVRKVIRNGAGSDHLKNPKMMGDIVRAMKDTGALVSAKIRSGIDHVNIEDTVPELDRAGADIIILHPRLAVQFYGGEADWGLIAKARQMTDKLLAASGDIHTPEDAKRVLLETGADIAMIGRQAVGSPYLFRQTLDFLEKGHYDAADHETVKAWMVEYAGLLISLSGKDFIVPIRSALIQYVKNFQNSKEIRSRLSTITTLAELVSVIRDW